MSASLTSATSHKRRFGRWREADQRSTMTPRSMSHPWPPGWTGRLFAVLLLAAARPAAGQAWDVETSKAPATTRLAFEATEGTWMSLDVSPDGRSIVFDLLGHIYEMPIAGGAARPLTSGRSWNMFPRYSPDGRTILFTSDRAGVEDQWLLDRASSELTNLTRAKASIYQGSWSADGRFVYASSLDQGQRIHVTQYGLHGSKQELFATGTFQPAVHLVDDTLRQRIYYEHADQQLPASGARLKLFDKRTGETSVYIQRPGGAINPALSPDGRRLAYVHRDYQRSVLVVHDLETRLERVLPPELDRDRQDYFVYHHGMYPGMAWHPNGREIVVTYGGQIRAVDAETGAARTIPFRAPVDRLLDKTIRFPVAVPESTATTRSHRWAQRIPAGVLYEALGDLHLRTATGRRQLTRTPAHETSPVFSAATGTLYYATWTDDDLGAIESLPLAGGRPTRLTTTPTQYGSLTLAPDGRTLAALRGAQTLAQGARLHEQMAFDLIVIGADGKERVVTEVGWTMLWYLSHPPALQFGPRGDELYFTEFSRDTLVLKRIGLDGSDEATLYRFPHAVRAAISPDLRWVAFEEYFRGYVTPFDFVGKPRTISAADGQGTTWRASVHDGNVGWSPDGATLTWTAGASFYEKAVSDIVADRGEARTTDLSFQFPVSAPASTVALTGARVITMDAARTVVENATILVRGDRIAAVGPNVPIPAGAHRIDVSGHTIMPGIVDVHAHYGGTSHSPLHVVEQRLPGLHAALAHGVTTMYEVYGSVDKDFWVSDMLRAGAIVGPRLYSTGQGIYGSRFFRPKQYRYLETLDDVRQALAYNRDRGATAVKDYLTPHRRSRHMLTTVAREMGLNVEVEPGGEAQTNLTRLVDGVTSIAHGMGLTPIYSDIIKMFAATEIGITPTLVVTLDGPQGESYFYERERVWENEKLLRFTTRDRLVARSRSPHYWPEDQFSPRLAAILKRLHDAGVSIQLGAHGQQLGLDAHWEMELFSQGGFSPMEVIQLATINPARHTGLDRDVGSIEVGKRADLVVLQRNPLDDIRNTRSIEYVVANGVVFAGDDLARVYPDPAPAGKMYFKGR